MNKVKEVIEWLNHNDGALSVIMSAISLVAAIGIPALIAYKQNKIALYEKRLDCYQKIEALNHFSIFCDQFDTFEKQLNERGDEFDPVFQCQRKYLDIHGILNDERKAQNSFIQHNSNMYAMSCFNEDSTILRSIKFLTKGIEESTFDDIEVTLNEFVRGLFGGNKDTKKMKFMQRRFTEAIEKSDENCKVLQNSLKMYWHFPKPWKFLKDKIRRGDKSVK